MDVVVHSATADATADATTATGATAPQNDKPTSFPDLTSACPPSTTAFKHVVTPLRIIMNTVRTFLKLLIWVRRSMATR